jgi:deoxyribodipyrimidine photo-lyase
MNMKNEIAIFWMRRDLRLEDNAALYHALKSGYPVLVIFIFDTNILDHLDEKSDLRVQFIHHQLAILQKQLIAHQSSLYVGHGTPIAIWEKLVQNYAVKKVYSNHDYEPYAIQRDSAVAQLLAQHGISWETFKDQCIFEKDEVLSQSGTPYTVFTPYSRTWKAKLNNFYIKPYPTEKYFHHLLQINPQPLPSLESIGFIPNPNFSFPKNETSIEIISNYAQKRDFPALNATSQLSVHLRFGTISIRSLVSKAKNHSETWLNELIWRDFYMNILHHFPHVAKGAFKPKYDLIKWRNNQHEFDMWCNGKTGYPIVDAGMRELNSTGFMHNRVRMIVASFLTKHLLIDWRWGEAYFAKKLLDFDLSANNGGWQWAAGSGCDAAPYFRIFNPYLQTKKFDPELKYIKKWIPELNQLSYPQPIVDHEFARKRCLDAYKEAVA